MKMEKQEVVLKRYAQAVACLSPRLQNAALSLSDAEKLSCEELRLRVGQTLAATLDGREQTVSTVVITAEDLRETVSRAARYSVHSYGDALAQGYLPLEGGHRLGICGTAVVKEGQVAGIRTIAALNLRIAGQEIGSADVVLPEVLRNGGIQSTLIISPPGFGKTTLLRDLIRQLSTQGVRVSVADERGELAAMHDGIAQFDLGVHTDVMDGCPKAQGAMILLKTMSPDVLALDEITSQQDVEAIAFAGHCGVGVLATAHAAGMDDLAKRPLYQQLLSFQVFERVITITRQGRMRQYTAQSIRGKDNA